MVVISRILRFFLIGGLFLSSYSPLCGMHAIARLLGRARMTKPIYPPKHLPLTHKAQMAFKPKTYTQPRSFTSSAIPKYSNPQPLSWWQRFTAWAKLWRMPHFNTIKSCSAFGIKRLMPLAGINATVLVATAEKAEKEVLEFTIKNIDAHPEYRENFLAYLKEHPKYFNIDTEPAIKSIIIHFLNKYPQFIYDISSIVINRLEHVSYEILDVVLQQIRLDREMGNIFAEAEQHKFSKKVRAILFNHFDHDGWARIWPIQLVIKYIPESGESIVSTIEQHITEIPAENIDVLYSYLTPEQQQRIERTIKQKLGISIESSDVSVIEKALLYHRAYP